MSNNTTVYFRYRLHDGPNIVSPSMAVEGQMLQKGKWLTSRYKLDKLTKHVRSMGNLQGLVEYQEYDPMTDSVLFTPSLTPPEVTYTRDELYMMERPELEKVAGRLNISSMGVTSDALIKLTLLEQKKIPAKQPSSIVNWDMVVP